MGFAKHETTYWSHKKPSNVRVGDFRDSEKMLCNRCPLKHEVRERERGRGEMLYENELELNTAVGKSIITNTADISDTRTCGMGMAIHNRVHKK